VFYFGSVASAGTTARSINSINGMTLVLEAGTLPFAVALVQ
jgi:hypothetical protein